MYYKSGGGMAIGNNREIEPPEKCILEEVLNIIYNILFRNKTNMWKTSISTGPVFYKHCL